MIYVNGNKEVVNVVAKGKVISAIYQGAQLLWEAIRSCFGSGMWIGKKPWIGKEAWKGMKRY